MFGLPFTVNVPVVGRGPLRIAAEVSSQFVPQKPSPGPMVKGKPLLQRSNPDNCHPPTNAFSQPLIPEPQARAWPTGNSYTQLVLIWCRVSKSDTARSCFGDQELMIWLAKPPPSNWLIRSALEPTSMDLENV